MSFTSRGKSAAVCVAGQLIAPAMWFSSNSTRVRASTTVNAQCAGGAAAVLVCRSAVVMKVSGASSARVCPAPASAAVAINQIFMSGIPFQEGSTVAAERNAGQKSSRGAAKSKPALDALNASLPGLVGAGMARRQHVV